ncbi:hypothetical protein D3C86_1429870 [compost metagenome]
MKTFFQRLQAGVVVLRTQCFALEEQIAVWILLPESQYPCHAVSAIDQVARHPDDVIRFAINSFQRIFFRDAIQYIKETLGMHSECRNYDV